MDTSARDFDVIVIGGGPAGFAAAFHALDYGKRVALIERNRLGGAGIHNGALASKTLWELSRDFSRTTLTDRGFCVHSCSIEYKDVVHVVEEAVGEREAQLKQQVEHYAKVAKSNFQFIAGNAKLEDAHTVAVDLNEGDTRTITSDNIILAMGSRPRKLDSIPIDEKTIVTSDGLHNLDHFPESMVVLGAGVIGCEYATMFASFGQTDVYVIDRADRILPFEDEDVAAVAAKNLEKDGVHIHRETNLESMTIEDGRVRYILCEKDGTCTTHFAEIGLVSIGRVPNTEHMGLEQAGVELSDRGHIVTDEEGQTSVDNIFAIGDLTLDICLVNVGEMEGRHVVEKLYGHPANMGYNNISTIMFLNPEVAGVGMNETQAKQAGIEYRMARIGFEYINRAIAMRNSDGFFKLIVTDDDEMRILGMRAVGPQASSAIQGVAILINQGKTIRDLIECIHPHPSIVEGVQECARMLLGTSIIKPGVFDEVVHCWRYADGKKTEMV